MERNEWKRQTYDKHIMRTRTYERAEGQGKRNSSISYEQEMEPEARRFSELHLSERFSRLVSLSTS